MSASKKPLRRNSRYVRGQTGRRRRSAAQRARSDTRRDQGVAPITFPTHADADAWLCTQRTDLIRGTWKAHDTGQARLRDYALTWLASRDDLKPRTAALYQSLLERHVLPILGDLRLRELTPTIVRDWHTALGRSTGNTARAQAYRLLRTLCAT